MDLKPSAILMFLRSLPVTLTGCSSPAPIAAGAERVAQPSCFAEAGYTYTVDYWGCVERQRLFEAVKKKDDEEWAAYLSQKGRYLSFIGPRQRPRLPGRTF